MIEETKMSDAIAMARLEGKIDVLNTHMTHMAENWLTVNNRLNVHSARISALEQKDTLDQGKEQGVTQVVKVLWAILAVLLTGGLATIAVGAAALMGAFK